MGNDQLYGDSGLDVFIFKNSSGQDVISSFENPDAGAGDLIHILSNVNGSGITNWATLQPNISQVAADMDVNWQDLISNVAVLIAIGGVIVAMVQFRKQMQLNFFADYTKRYQEIFLNLPSGVFDADFKFDKLAKQDKEHTLRYMRAYFDLCSEELFLYQNGRIEEFTWREWKNGIRYTMGHKAFKDAWEIVKPDEKYYGEFSDFINSFLRKGD